MTQLEIEMASSRHGRLISRANELLGAIRLGVTIRIQDLTPEELEAMEMIQEERSEWERENRKE